MLILLTQPHLNPRFYTHTSNKSISLVTLFEEVHLLSDGNRKLFLKSEKTETTFKKEAGKNVGSSFEFRVSVCRVWLPVFVMHHFFHIVSTPFRTCCVMYQHITKMWHITRFWEALQKNSYPEPETRTLVLHSHFKLKVTIDSQWMTWTFCTKANLHSSKYLSTPIFEHWVSRTVPSLRYNSFSHSILAH